jgi:hypothetical protein
MMNRFKNVNVRSMGSIVLEVENAKLKAYIKYWIDLLKRLIGHHPEHLFLYNFYASKAITTPVRTENSFTQAIKRASDSILGKPMTVNSYRHAWEMAIQSSEDYRRATQAEREEIHRRLLHGTMMGQLYNYQRRDNMGPGDSNSL